MIWVVPAREPLPDAPYWPGRCWLAAIDAVAWPLIGFLLLSQVPGRAGIVLPVVGAGFAWVGLARVHTAIWINHRYRFTTWRLGRLVIFMLLVGGALKLAVLWR